MVERAADLDRSAWYKTQVAAAMMKMKTFAGPSLPEAEKAAAGWWARRPVAREVEASGAIKCQREPYEGSEDRTEYDLAENDSLRPYG
jgi:hypothetical protein